MKALIGLACVAVIVGVVYFIVRDRQNQNAANNSAVIQNADETIGSLKKQYGLGN